MIGLTQGKMEEPKEHGWATAEAQQSELAYEINKLWIPVSWSAVERKDKQKRLGVSTVK